MFTFEPLLLCSYYNLECMYLFSRPPYQCPQNEGRPFQSGVPGECQMQPQDEERSCHGNCLALFFLLVFKATQKQGTLSTN